MEVLSTQLTFKSKSSAKFRAKMRDKLSEFKKWCSKCKNSTEKCKQDNVNNSNSNIIKETQIRILKGKQMQAHSKELKWCREDQKMVDNQTCKFQEFQKCQNSKFLLTKINKIKQINKYCKTLIHFQWIHHCKLQPNLNSNL